MINGQIRDIELMASPDATEEKLIRLIEQKTMALIRASVISGAIVAGASDNNIKLLEEYAYSLGLAFQIRDDVLDEVGDSSALGKQTGSDREQNKSTFVTLYGLDGCEKKIQQLTQEALQAAEAFEDHAFISELALWLAGREH